ncbi:hypothetical protein M408DRAFT_44848, partial [Serendipita vermifera MAFF 305830]
SSLSVEVWQLILRHAIFIPDFLDPQSVEGDLQAPGFENDRQHRHNESLYWQSERIRNKLCLVCKSWNEYLSLFSHRFVRM